MMNPHPNPLPEGEGNRKKTFLTSRQINVFAFLACLALVGASFYFEYGLNLAPCPLCIMQRLFMMILGLVFLFALLQNPARKGVRVYAFISLFMALSGAALSFRQIWLQHHPLQTNGVCVPELSYMLKYLPLTETVKILFLGTGECGEVSWKFLHLTMPAWTLVAFLSFILISLIQLKRSRT